MRRTALRTTVLSLAGLFASVGMLLYFTSPRRSGPALAGMMDGQPASTEPAVSVLSRIAASVERPRTVEVTGILEPLRSVVVAAEVEGRVMEVPAEEHARVSEGDVLVRLDPVLLKAALDRTEAAVRRAASAHRLAQLELKRQRSLASRAVTSEAELERAVNAEAERRAALLEARALLEDARARLDRSEVRAPFAGILHRLDLEPGAYLKPGSEVAEIVDLSEVKVGVTVDEQQIVALREGDPVVVELGVYAGETFEGSIAALGRAPEDGSRQYPVVIRLPNPEERLLSGMIATARLRLSGVKAALTLPREAIRREFELDYVFVLEEDEGGVLRARRRRVVTRPVAFSPATVEIVSGLRDGERIAVTGVRELRDGVGVQLSDVGS